MSLIINKKKCKPFLGSEELGEVWLGTRKIYPEEIIIKHFEYIKTGGLGVDAIALDDNRILISERRTKYTDRRNWIYNIKNDTITETTNTRTYSSQMHLGVDNQIYGWTFWNNDGTQRIGRVDRATGNDEVVTEIADAIGTSSYYGRGAANFNNYTYFFTSSGVVVMDETSNFTMSNYTSGSFNYGFEFDNKLFVCSHTQGLFYITVNEPFTLKQVNNTITNRRGNNEYVVYNNDLYVSRDDGVFRIIIDEVDGEEVISMLKIDGYTGVAIRFAITNTSNQLMFSTLKNGVKIYDEVNDVIIDSNINENYNFPETDTSTLNIYTLPDGLTYYSHQKKQRLFQLYYFDENIGEFVHLPDWDSERAHIYINTIVDFSYIFCVKNHPDDPPSGHVGYKWLRIKKYSEENTPEENSWKITVRFPTWAPHRIIPINNVNIVISNYHYYKHPYDYAVNNFSGIGRVY